MPHVTNIETSGFEKGQNQKGETWDFLDLSGERLGCRIEIIPPGGTTSMPHYHTVEEEHVLILEGEATLHWGKEEMALISGDHVAFPGGVETAHHIVNSSEAPMKYLVFGERLKEDVVIYPEHKKILVKALNNKVYTFEEV